MTKGNDEDPASGAEQLAILRELKQQPAAVLIGWTPRGLRDSDAPRRKDGTYDGPKLVTWLLARELGDNRGDGELFEGGGDNSPNLERCRAEKARELKRKNDNADGLLIETEIVGRIIDGANRAFLERAKAIEQLYGVEVGNELRDMIDEWFEGAKRGVQKAKAS
jgi:hypothetical protein